MGQQTFFDKRKCASCVYRRKVSGGMYNSSALCCDYSGVTGHTCLHIVNGKVADHRGTDKSNCALYQEGDPERVEYVFKY